MREAKTHTSAFSAGRNQSLWNPRTLQLTAQFNFQATLWVRFRATRDAISSATMAARTHMAKPEMHQ